LFLYLKSQRLYRLRMISWDSIIWAATVAGVFGWATLMAEKLVSRQRGDDIAALIHLRDDDTWVERFLSAFDALFTPGNFSLARLVRSVVATAFGVVALWVLFDPILGLMETRADQIIPLWQAFALGIVINFVADFLSLAETRWLLNRFRHVRSLLGHGLLLLADLLFTAMVIWAAIALFRLMQGESVLHPVELIVGYSAYAIFFYSTFLTSIWAWGYASAILFVRILSSKVVERISNFEQPFAWLACVVSVMVFGLLLGFEVLTRTLPDDMDSRICNTFGGVLCTHEARLTEDEARVIALLTRACQTGDPSQCRAAYDRLGTTEGPQAANLLETACNLQGDMRACNSAGYLYDEGLGVAQDLARAHEFFTRACDGGDLDGCNNLGGLYFSGRGVSQDYARAHEFYTRVCDRGEMNGCNNLGFLYHNGLGAAQDYARAGELFTRACDGGDMFGCNNLGLLHEDGLGVAHDYARAHEFYNRACDSGFVSGCYNLGYLYQIGLGAAQDHARARDLYSRACEGGDVFGCYSLGHLYQHALGVAQDYSRAHEFFYRACEGGITSACTYLRDLPQTE